MAKDCGVSAGVGDWILWGPNIYKLLAGITTGVSKLLKQWSLTGSDSLNSERQQAKILVRNLETSSYLYRTLWNYTAEQEYYVW